MSLVQIVKLEPGAERWEFVAHGARYDRAEAADMIARFKARGCKAHKLTCPKVKG